MEKKINILVIPSDHFGCGKYRSVDPHVYIGEHYSDEFHVDIVYDLPKTNLEEFFKDYDIVHIHKQLDKNCTVIQMLKFLGKKVIVDVDDYFFLGNDHPMSLSAKKERWHEPIINHLKLADMVTTTTPIFADVLKKYNDNVMVFPNAIDPSEKQFSTFKTPSDKLRVGLICGSSHLKDIELLRGLAGQVNKDKVQIVMCGFDTNGTKTILNPKTGEKTVRPIEPQESVWCEYEKIMTNNYTTISKEHKDFLMQYLAGVDDPFVNEPYRRMWTRKIDQYATHYQNVDILLAPLKENDFNKMKSQLKFVECGFTDTGIIAQNFGAYTIDSVPMIEREGKINEEGNCLLVETSKNHKQWGKFINKLADNPDMVDKLKKNLSKYVREHYSIDVVCAQRVEAYKHLLAE